MTTLVMLTIAFFGILSYFKLPVSDLPDIDFPTITVTVTYPGANPETISNNVVVPLEQQFTTIEAISSISSTSYTGNATIVLQFDLDQNIDLAAADVQAAINAASSQLPKDLPYAPIYTKTNPTATSLLFFIVTSPVLTREELYNYSYTFLSQRLNIIEGVSQVLIYGSPQAVRLRVDPQKLTARGLDLNDVANAVVRANVQIPVGTLFSPKQEFTLNVDGQLDKAALYDPIIIKAQDGSIVRFCDIGQAIDSVLNDKLSVQFFEKGYTAPSVGLAIRKKPGANTLSVIQKVNQILPSLSTQLPSSLRLVRVFDQSEYILESVHEVQMTLLIAIALVAIVIFFYLGNLRDTLIPLIVLPLSILGAFIIILKLGFTLNILSLLGITLAVGYLVDDAVVVLENITCHVEKGESAIDAALKGSKEIFFTILSMTLCLCIVFIPIIFMQGIIGRILYEFAMTIVITVFISGFLSLTLTPLLCSKLLRKAKMQEATFAAYHRKMLFFYEKSLNWALKNPKIILGLGILSLGVSTVLIIKLPKDFLPPDDIGLIQGYLQTVDGTSPLAVSESSNQLADILSQDDNIASVVSVGGYPQDNEGLLYIRLKPLKERLSLKPLLTHMYSLVHKIPGTTVFLKPQPLINLEVGTRSSKSDYQYTMQSLSEEELYKYAPIMQKKFAELSFLSHVNSDLDITQPRCQVHILRDRASLYQISALQVEQALNLAYATSNLSPINTSNYQYYAIMETFPKFYRDPSSLSQIWLHSTLGKMVPLTAITDIKESTGPLTVNHLNASPSATISFNLVDTALSSALDKIQLIAKQTLPNSVKGDVQGGASVFKSSFANLQSLLLITFFLIYIILGILYENFFSPVTVMSTLAPAAVGGLLSLILFQQSFSLYAFVGVIMLFGIVLKNGIILIDFANQSLLKKPAHEAIFEACLTRFRPILMTTFAAMMGAVPIAIGIGGSIAKTRQPLGIVIVGGLLFSQVVTLFLTPVVYLYIKKLEEKLSLRSKNLSS
jgi:HAE1 family hydrophobic/amphiphilic exporter-1